MQVSLYYRKIGCDSVRAVHASNGNYPFINTVARLHYIEGKLATALHFDLNIFYEFCCFMSTSKYRFS